LYLTHSVSKNNESNESIDVLYKTNGQMHHTMRHRAPDVLPTFENSAEDFDNLDDVFKNVLFYLFQILKFLLFL